MSDVVKITILNMRKGPKVKPMPACRIDSIINPATGSRLCAKTGRSKIQNP